MKVHAPDALRIARSFDQASESDTPRSIERIRVSNPSPINTLALFRLHSKEYALLFDDTANDNADYIAQQVAIAAPGTEGRLLTNPGSDVMTYGLPYEGKDCYLYVFDNSKKRLDTVLAERYPDLSRSSWQKHIRSGYVVVDGELRQTPRYEVAPDSQIVINLPELPDHSDKTLPIIYQDDDVTVFDKPIDILTHPKNPLDHEFTVMDIAKRYWTDGTANQRFGIVHRLDRDTSGVIVVARNQAAFDSLKQQFADRLVSKTYLAITDGIPKDVEAMLDLPIARNSARPGSFMVNSDGKPATTYMSVQSQDGQRAFVRLKPKTGRTHQLRVHMNYINCPIHGDRLYGKPADRLYLHAHQLKLQLPNGQAGDFISPLPDSFRRLMDIAEVK